MPKSNVPAKTIAQILDTPDDKLTEGERALKSDMADVKDEQAHAYEPKPPRIEIGHGMEIFKLPDGDTVPELDTIILGSIPTRGYWQGTGDESVMLCSSLGGKVGQPTEDGKSELGAEKTVCAECPKNEWGSAGSGFKGKACKEMRSMLLFMSQFDVPMKLSASPMSLQSHDKYYQQADAAGRMVIGARTKLSLERANRGEQKYSVLRFEKGADLNVEELQLAMLAKKKFGDVIAQVENADYWPKGTGPRDDVSTKPAASKPAGEEVKPEDMSSDDLPF